MRRVLIFDDGLWVQRGALAMPGLELRVEPDAKRSA